MQHQNHDHPFLQLASFYAGSPGGSCHKKLEHQRETQTHGFKPTTFLFWEGHTHFPWVKEGESISRLTHSFNKSDSLFFPFLFCHLLRCSLSLKCSPWPINTDAECWLTLSPTGPGGPTEPGSPRCPRFPSSPWGPITPWEPVGP